MLRFAIYVGVFLLATYLSYFVWQVFTQLSATSHMTWGSAMRNVVIAVIPGILAALIKGPVKWVAVLGIAFLVANLFDYPFHQQGFFAVRFVKTTLETLLFAALALFLAEFLPTRIKPVKKSNYY